MARKKTAKQTAKRQTLSSTAAKRMEKDFQNAPAKLIAQLAKEINLLKQKESKVKKALSKSKSQFKTSETRVKALTKTKTTSAGKKQLAAAKTAHSKITQTQSGLNKQLGEVSKVLATQTGKHAKLIALRKHISQFDKEWKLKAKQQKPLTSAKPKKTKMTKTTSPFSEREQSTKQQPNFETTLDDLKIDETTEVTS